MAQLGEALDSRCVAPPASTRRHWRFPDPVRSASAAWSVCRAPWLSTAEFGATVQRRLRGLLDFAEARSDFYRESFARLAPGDRRRLAALPVTTKSSIMENLDRVLTNPAVERRAIEEFIADPGRVGQPFAGAYAIWTSSGTSGKPGTFLHDEEALAVYDALQLYRFQGSPRSLGWWLASGGQGRFAMVAATGGHFAGAASIERLRDLYPWLRRRVALVSLMQPMDALVRELNAYRPDALATYPSVAGVLAREQLAGRLDIHPQQVWTGGECLGEATRRLVREAFEADTQEEYGTSEFASIAVGCRAGWMHVNSDWAIVEPVDEFFQPTEPGQGSHTVLLTNLANRIQPLIRYDLGDSVTVRAERCECGSRFPAIRVNGRADDLLELRAPDGTAVPLPPLMLSTVLEEDAGLYDFQLLQCGPRALRLLLGDADCERGARACTALREFLGGLGLEGIRIDVGQGAPQPEGAGAKIRRIVRKEEAAGESEPDHRETPVAASTPV